MDEIPQSVDEYIAACPAEHRSVLEKVRALIRENAPEATERMAYQMPTYTLKHNLIHFACAKDHLGIYPGGQLVAEWGDRLAGYSTSKGTIRIPWDAIDYDLIAEITRYRYAQDKA